MTHTDWHAPDELLVRFATNPAGIDHVRAASLEAHLIGCERCRLQLTATVGGTLVENSWARVADHIDRPHPRLAERAMRRVGVPDGWAKVLSATPGLRAPWVGGVVAVLLVVIAGSRVTETVGAFLVCAPLLPMVAVTAAFGSVSDPAGEVGVATPLHGWALSVRRTLVLSAGVFVLLSVTEVALGAIGAPVVAWVLPSLALAAGVLALGTWLRAEAATAVLAGGWVVAVSSARWIEGTEVALADSTMFAAPGRWGALVVLLAAVVVIGLRRARFETMEVFA